MTPRCWTSAAIPISLGRRAAPGIDGSRTRLSSPGRDPSRDQGAVGRPYITGSLGETGSSAMKRPRLWSEKLATNAS